MKNLLILFLLISSYISFAQENKSEIDALINKAELTIKEGNYVEGAEIYSKAITLSIDNPNLYLNRGVLYMSLKDIDKAISDFTKTIEINKELVSEAYFYRGVCKLIKDSEDMSSCVDFKKARELGFQTEWDTFVFLCKGI